MSIYKINNILCLTRLPIQIIIILIIIFLLFIKSVLFLLKKTFCKMEKFDEYMAELEAIVNDLESNSETKKYSDEEIVKKINRAEELQAICRKLLADERADIIKTAQEQGISLEELGLDDEDDEEYVDDEDEDEEFDDSEDEK